MNYPDICSRAQGFNQNANPFYGEKGLSGHPGDDESCGYGSEVHSPVSGKVIATYTPDKPASDGYVAVYILVQTAYELYEFCVGHLSEVTVQVGQMVRRGDLIGREGNKGVVYSGNTRITLAMQAAGDRRGSHRHYQCRPVVEVQKRTRASSYYLRNSSGYIKGPEGGYLEWAVRDSRPAGCVDFSAPVFSYDLTPGMETYEVLLLQRFLGLPKELQTGFYGPFTEEEVRRFQRAQGIPPNGRFGPWTRGKVNELYNRLDGAMSTAGNEIEAVSTILAEVETFPVEQRAERLAWLPGWLAKILALVKGS